MSKAEFIVEDLLSKIYQRRANPPKILSERNLAENMKYREILLEKR